MGLPLEALVPEFEGDEVDDDVDDVVVMVLPDDDETCELDEMGPAVDEVVDDDETGLTPPGWKLRLYVTSQVVMLKAKRLRNGFVHPANGTKSLKLGCPSWPWYHSRYCDAE
eukprot:Amastigsp_a508717_204.p3 type:complete len:112 gc:universal Amastigsp_a508717_204:103-438(+)